MLNLKQLLDISSTEIRLLIESRRLTIETRTVAAAEARVAHEARMLRMDEVKILAQVESDSARLTSGQAFKAWPLDLGRTS